MYLGYVTDSEFKVGAVADKQACLDAAHIADPSFEFITFDSATGDCSYYTGLMAPYVRESGEQPSYWVRTDLNMQSSAAMSCLTDQDARYLLMQLAYKGQTCNGQVRYDLVPQSVS